ncbi:hypothetical protein [Halovenus rubra]|uniref:hypothetical protein n=1 Tax=Halovenus rubra TaxID=869890 RepID=UPI003F60D959
MDLDAEIPSNEADEDCRSKQSDKTQTLREAIQAATQSVNGNNDEEQSNQLAEREQKRDAEESRRNATNGGQQLGYGAEPERLLSGSNQTVVELALRLNDLKQLERELSLAQRWTQGQIMELRDALGEAVGNGDPRLISELLLALADGPKESETLGRKLDAPVSVVEEVLEELTTDGVVYRDGHEWHLDT